MCLLEFIKCILFLFHFYILRCFSINFHFESLKLSNFILRTYKRKGLKIELRCSVVMKKITKKQIILIVHAQEQIFG